MEKSVGIIGYGNMGSAFAEQLKSHYQVLVFDIDKEKLTKITGIRAKDNLCDLLSASDVLILAVKPQELNSLLDQIKLRVAQKLIISIAAGISLAYIEKILGQVALVRAMPNLGIRIGESFTVFCRGTSARPSDVSLAKELLGYCGIAKEVSEDMMN